MLCTNRFKENNRQGSWATTHFDMDAVEAVGLVKMDILAQGGLAVNVLCSLGVCGFAG